MTIWPKNSSSPSILTFRSMAALIDSSRPLCTLTTYHFFLPSSADSAVPRSPDRPNPARATARSGRRPLSPSAVFFGFGVSSSRRGARFDRRFGRVRAEFGGSGSARSCDIHLFVRQVGRGVRHGRRFGVGRGLRQRRRRVGRQSASAGVVGVFSSVVGVFSSLMAGPAPRCRLARTEAGPPGR